MATNRHQRCAIVTALLAAVIIATGLAIGFGLRATAVENPCEETVPSPPTSPLSVPPSETKEGRYRFAAVAAPAEECSQIGTRIMARDGGSAIDAAIAVTLCLGVHNCHNCGIGGGHFLVYYNRASGQVRTINAREQAPAGATEEMFTPGKNRSSQEDGWKYWHGADWTDLNHWGRDLRFLCLGGMSIAIPGEIRGLYEAHKLGGRLPWAKLFEPTIKLCRDGFKVGRSLAYSIYAMSEFREHYSHFKDLVTNPDTNIPYKEGDYMRLPVLANTLETIAKEGPDAFYKGSLSSDIRLDILDAGGIITESDLANYTAVVSEPVTSTIHDNFTVYSSPPPSGGVVYQSILNILNGYNFSRDSVSSVDKAVLTWHRITEAFKHAYALRTQLGDSGVGSQDFKRHIQQLMHNMTSGDYGEHMRSQIDDEQTFGWRHYNPSFHSQWDHGTGHLSVLAPNGDAVSVTCTINLLFGSKVVGPRTGIVFNDEMDDFSTPNTKNYFGVPASPANYIAPWKRPLSSMCPSIVVGPDGDVMLVVGAAGGTKIPTSTALVTMETLWFQWGIKESIDYPRIHHQLFPSQLFVQREFPKVLVEGLRKKGHEIKLVPMRDITEVIVQGILQRRQGEITANSDYRKWAEADGY